MKNLLAFIIALIVFVFVVIIFYMITLPIKKSEIPTEKLIPTKEYLSDTYVSNKLTFDYSEDTARYVIKLPNNWNKEPDNLETHFHFYRDGEVETIIIEDCNIEYVNDTQRKREFIYVWGIIPDTFELISVDIHLKIDPK